MCIRCWNQYQSGKKQITNRLLLYFYW